MTQHPNHFDALRLGAALLVVASHSTLLFAAGGEPLQRFTGHVSFADVGVCVFFTISGYLVSESWWRDPHWARYLARRLLRIFPALAVVNCLVGFVLGPAVTTLDLHEYWRRPSSWTYLLNAFIFPLQQQLPGVFADNPFPGFVNGSLWTLQLEFSLYLILMLVGFGGRTLFRRSLVPLVCACLLVHLTVTRGRYHTMFGIDPTNLAAFGVFFFVGAALREFEVPTWVCGFACVPFTVALWALAGRPLVMLTFFGLVPSLTTWLAFAGARRFRLKLPGDYSYGIYVFAFPIQQLLAHYFYGAWSFRALTVASLLSSVVVGMVSWHWVEKPALERKPRASASAV